jgi:nucleotide-binding universal stress UspA family protein
MRVLLFADLTSDADRLVGVVVSASSEVGGHVRVLSVVPRVVIPPPPPPPWEPDARITSTELAARADISAARLMKRLAGAIVRLRRDLAVDAEARSGTVQDEIVEAAVEWSADLIVMGIGGRTRLERWAASRVARAVVSRAPCSVYVVREKASRGGVQAFEPGVAVENRTWMRA